MSELHLVISRDHRLAIDKRVWQKKKKSISVGIDYLYEIYNKKHCWASLVAQWLRICLLMQGTRVRALVREDTTCRGATRPVSHNY